jgi:hypothetical protein
MPGFPKMSRYVRCNCTTNNCQDTLLPAHVVRSHERSDLLAQSVTSHARFKRVGGRIIPSAQTLDARSVPRTFEIPLHKPPPLLSPDFEPHFSDSEVLDTGLIHEDLGITNNQSPFPNLGPNFRSAPGLLTAIDHYDMYNAATAAGSRPLTPREAHNLPVDPEQEMLERELAKAFEELQQEQDKDVSIDEDSDMDMDSPLDEPVHICTELGEDDPDPFTLDEEQLLEDEVDLSHIPPHLLSLYALVSWLHLQFHLPRIACNALLAIFTCILLSISPAIDTPFITLQSSNRVLGVDKRILILPVCPSCRDVFPPAGSCHTVDMCAACHVNLFLPSETTRGNQRAIRMPVIKYPYLPLSEQLKSILKVPGVEAVLDQWRTKPRSPGKYTDIFDGDMCRTKLKDPSGKLFFSNLPDEKTGPNGELRIGVNLGVDWYVLVHT